MDYLITEQANSNSEQIDLLPTLDMLRIMNREDESVVAAVSRELPSVARAVDTVTEAFRQGDRLFYIGAGTSGRLGVLDASECPPTFGVSPELVQGIIAGGLPALATATEASEDDPRTGAVDLQAKGFRGADVLVGIAASGRTPYVLGAVREAKRMGAATIGVSCVPDSELSRLVDIAIAPVVGPEVVTGSTRLKAGTATKLVLNMLSTGVMIRTGQVYGNLMVNVQPKNEKLVARARRIIAAIAGVDLARATELLEASGRDVRTAIVMSRLQLPREEAEARLRASGGHLRAALGAEG